MKTSVIEVHDMLSVLTVDEVEKRIVKVSGVESATVNFAAGNATVRYDETRLEVADIKAIMHQRAHQSAGEPKRKSKHKPARKRAVVSTSQVAPDTASTVTPAEKTLPDAPAPAVSVVSAADSHADHTAPGAPPSTPVAGTPQTSATMPTAPAVDENKGQTAPDAQPSASVAAATKAASVAAAPVPAPAAVEVALAVPTPTAPTVDENKGQAAPDAQPSTPAAPAHGFLARIKGMLHNIQPTTPMNKPGADEASSPPTKPVANDASTGAAKDTPSAGLTGDEARRRLEKSGPNAMPDTALHPLRRAFAKLWAPVPWMLAACRA